VDFDKTEGKRGGKANGGGDGAGEIDSKVPDSSGAAPAEAGSDAAVAAGALAAAKRTLELSRDDFRKIGDKQRNRRANAIGKIVSLLARAPTYQDMALKDLEWFLMPAIAAGQYLIGETKPSAERRGGVVAMLLWARVSPEVDKRLSESKDKPPRLKAEEWTSGDIVRVIEVVGRKDAIKPLLAEFKRLSQPARTRKLP
jgi:hemolysin-activating ACP:hemolysin acyltransferase